MLSLEIHWVMVLSSFKTLLFEQTSNLLKQNDFFWLQQTFSWNGYLIFETESFSNLGWKLTWRFPVKLKFPVGSFDHAQHMEGNFEWQGRGNVKPCFKHLLPRMWLPGINSCDQWLCANSKCRCYGWGSALQFNSCVSEAGGVYLSVEWRQWSRYLWKESI